MRTTIRLDDALLVEAKTRAAQTGRTLNEVVADALRQAFARRDVAGTRATTLPTYPSRRLRFGVDLDDTADLLDRMDGIDT